MIDDLEGDFLPIHSSMVSQKVVTPVKTGVQVIYKLLKILDSGFRRNDEKGLFQPFYEFIIPSH